MKTGRFVEEVTPITQKIAKHVEKYFKVKFEELVCDYIKDEGGNWWLTNVKAFKLI